MSDAGFQIVEFGIFVQADGQCVHVASVHASISQITFELYAEAFGAFVPIFPVGCDETTHVDNAIFFRTHGHAVGQAEHLTGNLFDGLVLVALFACLDEIGVFGKTGRVEQNGFAVFVSYGTYFTQVLHGYGLSSGCIVGDGDDDERNPVGVFLQGFLQFGRIDVSLERNLKLCLLSLVDSTVQCESFASFNVSFGRIKV